MADGIYRPALGEGWNNLMGLYFDQRARRQQEEQFRAQQEARAQQERQDALAKAMEFGFKTGDFNATKGVYDALTPFGMAGDYDALKGAAQAGKKQQAIPTAQGQQNLATGLAAQISPGMDPLQQALTQLRGEESMRGQGVPPEMAGQIGLQAAGLAGAQQADFTDYTRRADYAAGGKYQTFFNPQTGKFRPVRGDKRDEKQSLVDAGYFPVNSVQFGGTPKDFASGVTPTTATQVQNKLVGLMESNDRLATLEQNFDPKFFEYGTQAKVWALQKAEKAGLPIPPKDAELLGDYQEFMRTVGEETLSFTVAIAASTFTDRLREHIESIRLSPDLAPTVAAKRIKNLAQIGRQSVARLNFALRNGIVAATDFDPTTGDLTTEGRNKLENAIPMYIPEFSSPRSNNRIDRLMENRYDALQKEAALNRIPPAERDAWVDERMQEEFFSEPPIGTEMQDVVESDLLGGLGQAGVPLPPEEGIPQLNMRRVR